MKITVINYSGNVDKTTISRHLLMPRIEGAELIAIESINADEGHQGQSLRGRQFGELQEYMQTVDNVVVDIGADDVEDLMAMMRRYRGSHEDFDFFVIPTVALTSAGAEVSLHRNPAPVLRTAAARAAVDQLFSDN